MDRIIYTLSIRGRIAYVIMCFEKYVLAKYPRRNWAPVCDMMWRICDSSDYIDNSAYRYMEIIPEYLYEFDNFQDAEFDYLTPEEYKIFTTIIPSDDPDVETIMHSIYSIAMEYAYTSIPPTAPDTIPYILKAEDCLKKSGLPLPDVSVLTQYTDPVYWWGTPFDGRYLSTVVHSSSMR